MAKARSAKRGNPAGLTLIDGGKPTATDADADADAPDAELADLRRMLAEAGAPQEILDTLDTGADPEQIVHQLIAAGLLATPDDTLAELINGWTPLLARGVDPLSAELTGLDFLNMMRQAAPDPDDVPPMLVTLIARAEERGGDATLAMLRVLAAIGPGSVRLEAGQAAVRLTATGLKDRPWVKGLGTPEVGSCFGYADETGSQEAIAITFRYGKREHGLAVLIDHELGGGIKDCWPTEDPAEIRTDYQLAARRYGLTFHDYPPAQARAILQRALDRPVCATQPDQVEDVGSYIELVRQRVALLPAEGTVAASAAPAARKTRQSTSTGRTVHRVKVTLRGSKPPIWRRLEVPSGITLHKLHHVIQAAIGWQDYHLWVFETPSGDYGLPDPELGHRSAASKKLESIARQRGDRLRYTYDFGDGWDHDIVVEEVVTAEPGVSYPRCVTGRRAGPPEDCGGVWGYQDLIDVLANPAHKEHAERVEWLGLASAAEFDPARFDLDNVNNALSDLGSVLAKR